MKKNKKNTQHNKEVRQKDLKGNKTNKEDGKSIDYEQLYKRALADYQNLKRRCEEEKRSMVKFSNEVLIEKLLNVVTDMELATKHTKDDGIKSIYNKLLALLSEDGLMVIDPINLEFNSLEHEAVDSTSGTKGKVLKVLQKGYKLNSKVLKPAIVVVGNGE